MNTSDTTYITNTTAATPDSKSGVRNVEAATPLVATSPAPTGGEAVTPMAATPGAGTSLWRNRAFNIFWAGRSLSTIGDAFALIALPLLVLQATGSIVQMGLVTG